MSQTEISNVFPTWFAKHQWTETPDGEPIGRFNERLAAQLYRHRAHNPDGLYRSNLAGTWHSKDTILKDVEAGDTLCKMFHQVMSDMLSMYGAKTGDNVGWRFAAWAMMYKDHGYATPHNHPNCHFSSVYYVDCGADTEADDKVMATGVKIKPGCFEALDTRNVNVQIPGLVMQPGFRLNPKPGMLVVFPSWLPHFVHPVEGAKERIAIACNGTVMKLTKREENGSRT